MYTVNKSIASVKTKADQWNKMQVFCIHKHYYAKWDSTGQILSERRAILKVSVPKSLENEFFKTGRYGHFSYQNIIHGGKIANMYLICK